MKETDLRSVTLNPLLTYEKKYTWLINSSCTPYVVLKIGN